MYDMTAKVLHMFIWINFFANVAFEFKFHNPVLANVVQSNTRRIDAEEKLNILRIDYEII